MPACGAASPPTNHLRLALLLALGALVHQSQLCPPPVYLHLYYCPQGFSLLSLM